MDDDPGGPVPLARSLERWRRMVGVAAPDTLDRIRGSWSRVAGPLAAEAEPETLVDGVLLVSVAEPAVAEAVRWRTAGWIDALAEVVAPEEVRRIEVRSR